MFPGHNSPVTLLKLDPLGKVLLSGDSEGRDRSIRLWELSTGEIFISSQKSQGKFLYSNSNYQQGHLWPSTRRPNKSQHVK